VRREEGSASLKKWTQKKRKEFIMESENKREEKILNHRGHRGHRGNIIENSEE
jgi:hypothetical protein